ncbi:MAG: hypothetical protein HRT35_25430, partial [Algicola sp.]|nr:hypothetical protein [Algicola sp.]
MFNIDDIDVISQQDDFITKGTKMWACLDFLAEHYKEADMSKISPVSLFFDDTWDVYGTAENNFLWSKWLPESKHHPLDLVSRIVTYNEIYVVNKKISSIRDAIRAFISTFMEIFTVKGIFIGERNQSFKNLAALSNTDILFIAQTTYSKSGTLCDTPYLGFNCVALCSQSVLPHAEFLLDGCSAPWIEQGISHRVWIKKLKNLGKDHHTVKSYPALSPGVVEALVQRAVPFVDEYFDLIKTVFGEIERLTKLHKKFGNYRVSPYVSCIITAKYGDQLHHILPLRCNVQNGKPVISSKWFT